MDETKKTKESPEIPEETLDEVSGGIQAGLICPGGPSEFGDPPPQDPPPRKPGWF